MDQGESADKLRALQLGREQAKRPNTNITGTDGGGVPDEPTVDDQRAAAALAMLPPQAVARLVITQGNDAGQSLEVRPGKTYTIGRGIDNDLVLTDIAVSRKHFDIRHENGSWVLADRGSGNGTLVNHRIEDAPFLLASGDVIEIGNTSFRFDVPNGVPRGPSSYDAPVEDDLELPTMSGRQQPGASEVATPHQLVTPLAAPGLPPLAAMARPPVATPGVSPIAPAVPSLVASPGRSPGAAPAMAPGGSPTGRSKTLPPPAPLPPPTAPGSIPRPRTQSSRPPPGYAIDRSGGQPQSLPPLGAALAPTMSPMQGMASLQPPQLAATLSLPQRANRPPPAVLFDPPVGSLAGGPQPTTLPGQGPPLQPAHASHPAHPARLPFQYPSAADLQQQSIPISARHAAAVGPISTRNAVVVTSGQPVRDATSTALVQPMSYANGQPAMSAEQQGYRSTPSLSRGMKLLIGGAGLSLVAAVAALAVTRSSSSSDPTLDRTIEKTIGSPPPKPAPPKNVFEPLRDPRTARSTAPSTPPRPDREKAGAPLGTPPGPPRSDKVATTAPATTTPATTTPATTTPATTAPATTTASSAPATGSSTPATPKTDKIAATPTSPESPPATPVAPRTDKVAVAATTQPKDDPARNDKRVPRRGDKRTDRDVKTDKKTPSRAEITASSARTNRVETASNTPRTDRKRSGRSTQDVKNSAAALYRAKRFSDAAAAVTAALPGFSGADSQELKTIAAIYSQLGKDYNVGMAPGTKATEAYLALRRARNFDHDVGSAYVAEIERVLVSVAAKAALSYTAAKDYEMAFQAVRQSEALGSTSPTNKSVRDKLEEVAAELYRTASSELAKDPESAKKKARQIQGLVDQKNPLYVKAAKLLNGS